MIGDRAITEGVSCRKTRQPARCNGRTNTTGVRIGVSKSFVSDFLIKNEDPAKYLRIPRGNRCLCGGLFAGYSLCMCEYSGGFSVFIRSCDTKGSAATALLFRRLCGSCRNLLTFLRRKCCRTYGNFSKWNSTEKLLFSCRLSCRLFRRTLCGRLVEPEISFYRKFRKYFHQIVHWWCS